MSFIEMLQEIFIGAILYKPVFIGLIIGWLMYVISTIKDKFYLKRIMKRYDKALEENKELRFRLNIKGDFELDQNLKEARGEA